MPYYTTAERSNPLGHWIRLTAKNDTAAKREAARLLNYGCTYKHIYVIKMKVGENFKKGETYFYYVRKTGYNFRWTKRVFKRR